jgi:hypothetical protein
VNTGDLRTIADLARAAALFARWLKLAALPPHLRGYTTLDYQRFITSELADRLRAFDTLWRASRVIAWETARSAIDAGLRGLASAEKRAGKQTEVWSVALDEFRRGVALLAVQAEMQAPAAPDTANRETPRSGGRGPMVLKIKRGPSRRGHR